jgi:hypothetical protein
MQQLGILLSMTVSSLFTGECKMEARMSDLLEAGWSAQVGPVAGELLFLGTGHHR